LQKLNKFKFSLFFPSHVYVISLLGCCFTQFYTHN